MKFCKYYNKGGDRVKKFILVLFFLALFSGSALARPIIMYSTIGDGFTVPILIYSDDKMNVYIPEDMINFNLFWSTYPRDGNFRFTVYIEPTDESERQAYISSVKARISDKTVSTIGRAYPDLLAYVAEDMYFDMAQRQVTIFRDVFIDRNGNHIATRQGIKETTLLNDEYPMFQKIADAASKILENAKNDPVIADKLKDLNRTNEVNKDDTYYDTLEQGIQAINEKNYDGAVEYLGKAISINPNNYKAYGWLGVAYVRQNDLNNAFINYNKAISLEKKNPIIYENRGDAYLKTKQYELALADFSRAIELSSERLTPSLCFRKAKTHELLNQTSEAVDAYLIFLENNNGDGRLSDVLTQYAKDYIKNNK
jgi:tetratricopeptide (TPR) repeat protein